MPCLAFLMPRNQAGMAVRGRSGYLTGPLPLAEYEVRRAKKKPSGTQGSTPPKEQSAPRKEPEAHQPAQLPVERKVGRP
ncbi:hypothetical protein METBIDRAFT_29317 [Metschnikowia bicuspidata var. bicuspidata NRRL YB-4993]|uniref:Uncharacterized protein n=1 Tax=Metschnikowia bicuspidata var. bicuspidata NRRL YB-4993 TaxID=869754 RepID=A0A1A0HFE5_9ASCO|nr:hypothetical protein METBIDRAFT_29317 [Metschnikowia bicuspidata var. bicuspidata NRRL YB-4993]OBA22721.1 hypothetical protein METBIDRAFT_29317 [Metschnikowia bicuspidata var. bicuspidata NRRL YB-4993]